MNRNSETAEYEIICVIVHFGLGSKVLRIAKQCGICGGVIFLCMGALKSRLLEFLELSDERKETVLMIAEKTSVDEIIKGIDREFNLKKPNHGIAFTMPLTTFIGSGRSEYSYCKSGGNIMYNSIFVVVDRGKAELVMDAAVGAGARGGTIIRARGAGMNETTKHFLMDIEPEKEIVMILSGVDGTEKIVTSIRDSLEIGKSGNSAIFCQEVTNAYGLF